MQADDGVAILVSLVDACDDYVVETFSSSLQVPSDFEIQTARTIAVRVAEREGQDPEHYRIRRFTQSTVADSL